MTKTSHAFVSLDQNKENTNSDKYETTLKHMKKSLGFFCLCRKQYILKAPSKTCLMHFITFPITGKTQVIYINNKGGGRIHFVSHCAALCQAGVCQQTTTQWEKSREAGGSYWMTDFVYIYIIFILNQSCSCPLGDPQYCLCLYKWCDYGLYNKSKGCNIKSVCVSDNFTAASEPHRE